MALFAQTFGSPARMPAEEAVATLRDAWTAPAFAAALSAFDAYTFTDAEQLRGVPVTITGGRHDRLLLYSRQAPRARALLPWARHVTLEGAHVPVLRRPGEVTEVIRTTATKSALGGSPKLKAPPAVAAALSSALLAML